MRWQNVLNVEDNIQIVNSTQGILLVNIVVENVVVTPIRKCGVQNESFLEGAAAKGRYTISGR